MLEVKVNCDSINPLDVRLTTMVLVYPHFIHAQLMTHRAFSRNASSSRAIPVAKMLRIVRQNPAQPILWFKNQSGMQTQELLTTDDADRAKQIWADGAEHAIQTSQKLLDLGVHKSIANRPLSPYIHMTTIVSATEWGNFFNLRVHSDAQFEHSELSYLILQAYRSHQPTFKAWGEWHLPFTNQYISENLSLNQLIQISSARCARVSYMNYDGDFERSKDYALHDDLVTNHHSSPLEHPAEANNSVDPQSPQNFDTSWLQYRKMIPKEFQPKYDALHLLQNYEAYRSKLFNQAHNQ